MGSLQRTWSTAAHGIFGAIALGIISTFMLSTVTVELLGDRADIVMLKRYIAYALIVLVPIMGATAGVGTRLARQRGGKLIERKRRRMRVIGMNGLLVLAPSAIALFWLSSAGRFGLLFGVIQGLEFIAGTLNIYLLSQMMRDGFRLTGRFAMPRTKVDA